MILTTSDSGIYEGYVDMYKTNVGYDSKSQFAKQYEYSTSKKVEEASSDKTTNSSGVAGTKMVSSKDEIPNWGGNYADFAGNTVEIDGLVYKCGDKGPAMPLFLQGHDNPWSSVDIYPGGSSKPIAKAGCGYTSTAMAITYLTGHFVSPAEMTQKANGKYHESAGINHGKFLPWIAPQYGLQFKAVGFNEFKQGLQEGKVGITNTAAKDSSNNTWSKNGHVIAVRGLTEDGKFLVNNPNARGEAQLNREWTDAEMQRNCGVYYLLWK